ncbi:hypothetical protein C8J57DRAFT_1716675 [Mycena rebaudengoi]|nr:hypothetical protein C8J57DRAFT_1716675 [Mycena rebaudengoi]
MPLFGSSHTHDTNKLEKTHHGVAGEPHHLQGAGAGYDDGMGTTAPMVGHHHMANDTYPATTAGTGAADTRILGTAPMGMGGGLASTTMGHHNAGLTNTAGHEPTMAGHHHAGTGAAIPPIGAVSGTQNHHSSGGGGAMTGKIEHAIGTIVGSSSLKAKGLQKEEEARGLKIQSQELAEAERLESQAALRRERAVAHGAHPDNRHVGGIGGAGNNTTY